MIHRKVIFVVFTDTALASTESEIADVHDVEYLLCRDVRKGGFNSPAFCTDKVSLYQFIVFNVLPLLIFLTATSRKKNHGFEKFV